MAHCFLYADGRSGAATFRVDTRDASLGRYSGFEVSMVWQKITMKGVNGAERRELIPRSVRLRKCSEGGRGKAGHYHWI